MESKSLMMYLAVGLGLFFLLPTVEAVEPELAQVATFLVLGYWGLMGIYFLIFAMTSIFAEFGFSTMLYNLWLFCSLMCVAVGVLAIIADGVYQARWGVLLIIYGGTIGYLNRKEL